MDREGGGGDVSAGVKPPFVARRVVVIEVIAILCPVSPSVRAARQVCGIV